MPGGARVGAGPDGEDHRQPRALEPEPAEVVVRRRVLEGAAKRRVADQELRVGLLAERNEHRVGQEHLGENDRGRALGRDGNGVDVLQRRARRAGWSRRRPRRRRRAEAGCAADRHGARTRSRRSARGRSRRRAGARSARWERRAPPRPRRRAGGRPAPCSRRRFGRGGSRRLPLKNVTRLPSRSRAANSRVPKSVSSTPSFETWCSTSLSRSSSYSSSTLGDDGLAVPRRHGRPQAHGSRLPPPASASA